MKRKNDTRSNAFKALAFVVAMLVFSVVGCEKDGDGDNHISGILSDIRVVQEDNYHQAIYVYFDDGRIVTLRREYNDVFIFKKNKLNHIDYSSSGKIKHVSADDSK